VAHREADCTHIVLDGSGSRSRLVAGFCVRCVELVVPATRQAEHSQLYIPQQNALRGL
jgi:hypothetical protein